MAMINPMKTTPKKIANTCAESTKFMPRTTRETAEAYKGSLVGMKVKYNPDYAHDMDLFENVKLNDTLEILDDNQGKTMDHSGLRLVVAADKKGHRLFTNAARLIVLPWFKKGNMAQKMHFSRTGTADTYKGSLVGKKVQFNLAHKDIKDLHGKFHPRAILKVTSDDKGTTHNGPRIRMIKFKDRHGNEGYTNAVRLNVIK